jgi:two-component system, cell cycle sensor histidine kinase and response regulator CckA
MGKLAQVLRWGIFPHAETILIVEPDQILRLIEARALSPKYKIVQTSSPEEAVRVAAHHESEFDLLLTPARFPNMDGWELMELIKLDYPNLKVIYVSGSINTGVKAHTSAYTAIVLEENGFNPGRLLQAVQDTLELPIHKRGAVRDKTDSLFSLRRWAKPPI